LNNSKQAQHLIQKLIETQGQPDREQFCIILLNARNAIIGLNIVSTGDLTSAQVHPREVLKPAILANSCAMILCHNHPSGDLLPSKRIVQASKIMGILVHEHLIISMEDERYYSSKRIVQASKIMGILVHEHLIISMEDERYYSFADNGIIKRMYDEID